MRDAAADLDFEKAARLRDEVKRLREMELAIIDDPMARDVRDRRAPSSGREKGKHNKGVARHRTAEEQERFRKLDEARAAEAAEAAARPNMFRKPTLDEMGRADGRRAGKTPLFAKALARRYGTWHRHADAGRRGLALAVQEADRAARRIGRIMALPGEGRQATPSRSLFRKNSLDEMTVRRTEKPVDGEVKPVKREKVGIGSYEDPADVRNQGRRSKKSGRPGH